MTDATSRMIADITFFTSPVLELIAEARMLDLSTTVTYLQVEQAKSAVYGYLTGRASIERVAAAP